MKNGIALLLLLLSLGLSSTLKAGTPMKGSYIVDSSGTTAGTKYKSLQAAFASLDSNGASGKVTFLLAGGSYPALRVAQKPSKAVVSLCRLSPSSVVTIDSVYCSSGLGTLFLDTLTIKTGAGGNKIKFFANNCIFGNGVGGTDCNFTVNNSELGRVYGGNIGKDTFTFNNCKIANVSVENFKDTSGNNYLSYIVINNSVITDSVYIQGAGGMYEDAGGYRYLRLEASIAINKSVIKKNVRIQNAQATFTGDSILGKVFLDTSKIGFFNSIIKKGIIGFGSKVELRANFISGPVYLKMWDENISAEIYHNTIVSSSDITFNLDQYCSSCGLVVLWDNILINYNKKSALAFSAPGSYVFLSISNLAISASGSADTVTINGVGQGKYAINQLNSYCYLPTFVSATDLHCTDGWVIKKAKTSFTDMDGDTGRSIGADNLIANDAGIKEISGPATSVCSGSHPVKVKLKNYGFSTLTKATLNFSINGTTKTPYAWTGSLAHDSTMEVTLGTTIVSSSTYIKSWSTSPNGATDGNLKNDTATSLITISVPTKPSISGATLACANANLIYTTAKTASATFSWSVTNGNIIAGAATDSITVKWSNAVSGTLSLIKTFAGGCKDSTTFSVTIDTACVWPGDANLDKIVNNKDLLNLGLGYGVTGKPRPSANISWIGQPAPDWKDTFTNNVNYKHADCDGDSIIAFADTLAISANYSKTHLKTYSANQGSPTDPHLSIVLSKDSAQAGEVVKADIMYGNSSGPASNVYGLAFSVIYPAGMIDTIMADFSGSWLSTNKLNLSKIATPGQLDMAVARTDQKDTSGFGKLATLYFKLGTTLPSSYTKLNISIAENTQINAKAQYKPVFMQSDSILVRQTFTGITAQEKAKLSGISLFPNPANNELMIRFENAIPVTLNLKDMTGKEITFTQYFNGKEYKMNTSGLPSGIYFLNISSEQSVITKKIVIQH